jgi:Asp-tRNA(Asn)/Glu-tRNA(Gln) amidotransferase A subunit family amidase
LADTNDKTITPEDLAVADRVAGWGYREADHTLMLSSLAESREKVQAIRRMAIAPDIAPAIQFQPLPPYQKPTIKNKSFHPSRGALLKDLHPKRLAFATVIELARLIKARKISSVELTQLYLDRLATYGPRLNCVVTLCADEALRQAQNADAEIARGHYRGVLHGIPYGAKDLLATQGIPTTYGAEPYRNQVLDYDATVIKRLQDAGAVLVAKLTMGELAVNDVWFGGKTRNPWNPTEGSSGSSAGSGSATAAGLVGFSIGTETLGSIVSPCVRNGVTGLRPTFGQVSRHGAMALAWSLDKIGPMCRGVEDCAAVFDAIRGPDGKDLTVTEAPFIWKPTSPLSVLRVGVDQASFDALEAGSRNEIYADVLRTLETLGVSLVPINLPQNSLLGETLTWLDIARMIICSEGAAAFQQLNLSGQLDFLVGQGKDNWPNIFRVGSTIPAADYLQVQRLRRMLQAEMADALQDIDVYVSVPFEGTSLVCTNLTGNPTVITRCGMLDGVPQSVEFVGGLYQEADALRLALAYEQATPWHRQWPDVEKLPMTPP